MGFHKRGDGSHRGLADWYPEFEAALVAELDRGSGAAWDSGWYASKHELASARIWSAGDGRIYADASVSDDFDTEGVSGVDIPFTADLDEIRAAVDLAWEGANANQRDNAPYEGFKVLDRRGRWVETIIVPQGWGHEMPTPPGDNYHRWGWQGDGVVPKRVRKAFNRAIRQYAANRKSHGFRLVTWEGVER